MKLLKYQHINQEIKEKLLEIAFKIKGFNKSGENDISKYAESYFLRIFKILYKNDGWQFDRATKVNQDTYDLYDEANKICIQITSNNRKTKLEKTINLFENKHKGINFNQLVILFLTDKKPKTTKSNYKIDINTYSIIEFGSLIENKCTDIELLDIRDIFNQKSNLEPFQLEKSMKYPTVEEFLRCMKIESELREELVKENLSTLTDRVQNPYNQFKSSRFILRDYNCTEYPEINDSSRWSRTYLYDFYERGILVWPDATYGTRVRINQKEEWYIETVKEYNEDVPEGFETRDIRIIAKLPYQNILYWKFGDDTYYRDYHIYCRYNGIEKSPFVEIEYKINDGYGYFLESLAISKRINRDDA